MKLLWDLESDGLLDTVTRIHCIVAVEVDTGEEWLFRPGEIEDFFPLYEAADFHIGHNLMNYDIAVLSKLHGLRRPRRGTVLDTLHWAAATWPGIKGSDYDRNPFPPELAPKLRGSYSLEAFGYRLGEEKGTFGKTTDWKEFSEEMLQYCRQDVNVNLKLYRALLKKGLIPENVAALETECAYIMGRAERHGVRVDLKAAQNLYGELANEKEGIKRELLGLFQPWFVAGASKCPRLTRRRPDTKLNPNPWPEQYGGSGDPIETEAGTTQDGALREVTLKHFNPTSRDQIADRLMKVRGWKPRQKTKAGKPKLDEKVLAKLRYPEAKQLLRLFMIQKRLGQISDGKEGWLRREKNGRIHGRVRITGTGTVRASHLSPNLGQVPKKGKPYGEQCRTLFVPDVGDVLVGCDAAGAQMRILSHYLAKWDGGALGQVVCDPEGDVHTHFMSHTGIVDRDVQKQWTYATLLNAQPPKLASIMGSTRQEAAKARARLFKAVKLDKLNKLLDKVHARGWMRALDGRKVPMPSRHTALATVLQAGEAVVMKLAMVIADCRLQDMGFVPKADGGEDYEFVLWVHDEFQLTVRPAIAETVGAVLEQAITDAGELVGLRVPMAGDAQIGSTWKETH